MNRASFYLLQVICLVLLAGCGGSSKKMAASVDFAPQWDTLSIAQMDTLKIAHTNASTYFKMANYALALSNDTSFLTQGKGHILLSILADHLTQKIKNGQLSRRDDTIKMVESLLASVGHVLPREKVSSFLKVAHYTCEGRFSKLFDRFWCSSLFFPVVFIGSLLLIFVVANVFGFIKWKFRKRVNIILAGLFIIFIICAITFKSTCNENVKDDSFYGIPFE